MLIQNDRARGLARCREAALRYDGDGDGRGQRNHFLVGRLEERRERRLETVAVRPLMQQLLAILDLHLVFEPLLTLLGHKQLVCLGLGVLIDRTLGHLSLPSGPRLLRALAQILERIVQLFPRHEPALQLVVRHVTLHILFCLLEPIHRLLLRHLLRQLLSLQLLQLPLAPHLALAVPLDCALLIRLQVLALVALQLLIMSGGDVLALLRFNRQNLFN
mmetsp:Transcript_12815/g.26982  ORF Transcript_12815/g.26982 Transcript_12815/m.26982 type:complete len:218 (+) Transcript_12815:1000-1653(+)